MQKVSWGGMPPDLPSKRASHALLLSTTTLPDQLKFASYWPDPCHEMISLCFTMKRPSSLHLSDEHLLRWHAWYVCMQHLPAFFPLSPVNNRAHYYSHSSCHYEDWQAQQYHRLCKIYEYTCSDAILLHNVMKAQRCKTLGVMDSYIFVIHSFALYP